MPKHSSHILELARKGAQHRLDELKAENRVAGEDISASHGRREAPGDRPVSRTGRDSRSDSPQAPPTNVPSSSSSGESADEEVLGGEAEGEERLSGLPQA